jgi:hypothetical protein
MIPCICKASACGAGRSRQSKAATAWGACKNCLRGSGNRYGSGKSGRGLPHSKSWRTFECSGTSRSVLECGSPPPLWVSMLCQACSAVEEGTNRRCRRRGYERSRSPAGTKTCEPQLPVRPRPCVKALQSNRAGVKLALMTKGIVKGSDCLDITGKRNEIQSWIVTWHRE